MTGIPKPRDFNLPGAQFGDLDHHRMMVDRSQAHVLEWLENMSDREVHPASALISLLVTTRHFMKLLGGPTGDQMIRALLDTPADIPPELQRRYHEAVAAGVERMQQGGGRPS